MSVEMTVEEVTRAVSGRLLAGHGEEMIRGVSLDSRTTAPGELFFAIPGDKFDGHQFITQAFTRGAAAAVVHAPRLASALPGGATTRLQRPLIAVQDVVVALGELAAQVRRRQPLRVVGITGSVGKTTAKDLTASVLAQKYNVLRNEGNFNNEIGVPLTLFGLLPEHEAMVVEMAMRGQGQIRYLARLAQPSVGLITNVGVAHMELLGSQEAIADAKGELLEELTPDGVGLLNRDDPFFARLRERAPAVLSFGQDAQSDVSGEVCRDMPAAEGEHLRLWSRRFEVEPFDAYIRSPGRHQLYNALAATTAGLCLGVPPAEIAAGLAAASVSHWRMELLRTRGGVLILNDAYNASPASMAAALETLADQAEPGRRFAVLGDMLELGSLTEDAHREVGRKAVECGVARLITVGTLAQEIAAGAAGAGMPEAWIAGCASNAEAVERLRAEIRPGDVVLVKGSRAMQMEGIVRRLTDA